MTMTDTDRKDDSGLDSLFAAARAERAAPSDAMMARVLEAALAEQAGFARRDGAAADARGNGGFWSGIWAALGGWPAAAGLSAAVMAGVVIGVSPALGVGETVAGAWGGDTTSAESYLVDIAPGLGFGLGLGQDEGDAG
jgi:hypothetical protein